MGNAGVGMRDGSAGRGIGAARGIAGAGVRGNDYISNNSLGNNTGAGVGDSITSLGNNNAGLGNTGADVGDINVGVSGAVALGLRQSSRSCGGGSDGLSGESYLELPRQRRPKRVRSATDNRQGRNNGTAQRQGRISNYMLRRGAH